MSDVLKVFLGSPGDVAAARSRVHAVVDALNEDPLVQPRVEVVDWQRTPHTRNAWLPPQTVIAQGITRPSACDVAVFVFHARR